MDLQNCIRYLYVFLDDALDFKDNIKRKCQTAMMNYFKINSIHKYLTREATEVLCLSFVISNLYYCNVLLYGVSQTELAKFQGTMQNMCAKLVLNRGWYDSLKQSLYDLHWIPNQAR